MDGSQLNFLLELPFPNNRTAEIIYEVLRIDIEPSRSTVKKKIKLDNNIVKINLLSQSAINLRVAVNAIFDNLHLATETLNVFGPPSASFDHYNNKSNMPEHTPAPTPSRAVYGFVLYLAMKSCFFMYVVWSVVPDDILLFLNLNYLPQKYWAIAVPVQVLVATFVFAFFIYPGMNLCIAPAFDEVSSVSDKSAIFRCAYREKEFKCQEIIKNDMWIITNFCAKHLNGNQEVIDESNRVQNVKRYCDCINKARCMASREPSYKKPVEPVTDLPLSEVNRILYS